MHGRVRMRTTLGVLLLFVASATVAADRPSPIVVDQWIRGGTMPIAESARELLRRGIDSYRSGELQRAADDLRGASEQIIRAASFNSYFESGRLASLAPYETAQIYLALTYDKLGDKAKAKDAMRRAHFAERIEPVYRDLDLGRDQAAFRALVQRADSPFAALVDEPIVKVKNAPPPSPTNKIVIRRTAAEELASQKSAIEDSVAKEVAELRREAEQKLAAQRAELERDLQTRLERERIAAEEEARKRLAAVRAETEKLIEERQRTLRHAESMISDGRAAQAASLYEQLLAQPQPLGRPELVEIATGYYRIGDFPHAADLLGKLTIQRGEEDLHYYRAVAFFETGRYAEAASELQLALPFIEVTSDVAKYREKIQKMGGQSARRQ